MASPRVKIVGYGSLISKKSLRKTLRFHSNFKEVWIHDYKRVFDLRSLTHLFEPWDKDIAILNVEKSPSSRFNAVIFDLSLRQFNKIIKREKTYSHIKVKYSDYRDKKIQGEAFLFVGLEQNIDKTLNPRTHYFHICRLAAHNISDKFGKDWDKTTYLSNGVKVINIKNKIPLHKYREIIVPYVKTKLK